MNGQQGGEQGGQGHNESHLSYLLNSAGAQGLMGYPGLGGAQRFGGYGMGDASLEEQILQRASALRAEALMQQQAQQRQHHLGAALAALQQQQQLAALSGLNPSHLAALSAQEQEALLGRAAALRELGISNGPASASNVERLQQLELNRLEELERRRQQLAALAGLSGAGNGGRPAELSPAAEQLTQDSVKSDSGPTAEQAPQSSAPDKAKEDLRKTPGTVIVPCRARGMPMDHNFKTAYFVISEDAKHGEDLVCSYFACRNGGVKFRYCAHCMAPVAKRNFCRRHDHGMSAKTGDLKGDDDEDVSMDEAEPKEVVSRSPQGKKADKPSPAAPVPKIAMPVSSLDMLSKAASSTAAVASNGKPVKEKPLTEKKAVEKAPAPTAVKSASPAPAKRKMPTEENPEVDPSMISEQRREMWKALLLKRPRTKDPLHLSSWLNDVLTVSDFDIPVGAPEIAPPAPNGTLNSTTKKQKVEKSTPAKKDKPKSPDKKKRKAEAEKAESFPKKDAADGKAKEKKPKTPPKTEGTTSKTSPKVSPKASPKVATKEPEKEKEVPAQKTEDKKEPVVPPAAAKPPVVAEDKVTPHEKAEEKKQEEKKPDEDKPKAEEAEKPKEATKSEDTAVDEAPAAEKSTDASEEKDTAKESEKKEDGFAGSFADWRDRKKDKALKKGPGSLKK